MDRANILRAQALRVLEEADRLDNLPKEPLGMDDGTNIVFFRVRFRGDVPPDRWNLPYGSTESNPFYTYVAVKARGVWHASGRKDLQWKTWDAMIEWITSRPHWEIWTVSELSFMASSEEGA